MWINRQKKKLPYADSNRLADVMALIQVLALDKHSHRSEDGLKEELQGNGFANLKMTHVKGKR